ncbi:MAG: helix-turn-helix domain-containing protein [Cellulomonadaceae bacterium]|nr:helix-turn-helix domain-containing protein [Cellulomonadaceae bacterium]
MPESTARLVKDLGSQIRALRISQDITQVDLAQLINVSKATIVRLESGASVSSHTLVAVVRALGRAEWITSLNERMGPSPLELLRESRRQPQVRQRARRTVA